MAKVTFGPIVSEARNKVGGVVFSRNPHGAYSRAWQVPHNPNTTAQAAARLSMRELSQRWSSTLTDEQRAAWRSLGKLYLHIDVFRQKSIRPGLQTYLRSNLALASVGSAPLDDAPRKLSATDPQQVTASAVSGAPPVITVNCDSAPAINEAVQIWVSPGLSSGRSYFYKYMRLVATFSAGTAGPWDPSAGWAARFASLTFPSKLGIGVRYVNVETGATGPMRTTLISSTPGGFALQKLTVTLTNAEFLALPTTGITLLAAPGANKIIVFFRANIFYRYVAPVGNIDPAAYLGITCGTINDYASALSNPAYLTAGPGQYTSSLDAAEYNGGNSLWFSNVDGTANLNQPAVLRANNNGAGDFTGGDPAATVQVDFYYDVVTV